MNEREIVVSCLKDYDEILKSRQDIALLIVTALDLSTKCNRQMKFPIQGSLFCYQDLCMDFNTASNKEKFLDFFYAIYRPIIFSYLKDYLKRTLDKNNLCGPDYRLIDAIVILGSGLDYEPKIHFIEGFLNECSLSETEKFYVNYYLDGIRKQMIDSMSRAEYVSCLYYSLELEYLDYKNSCEKKDFTSVENAEVFEQIYQYRMKHSDLEIADIMTKIVDFWQ